LALGADGGHARAARYTLGWHPAKGWRDTFAFLIACQLVRIFPPGAVFLGIVGVVSTVVAADFVGRHLLHMCGPAMHRACAGRSWACTYRRSKSNPIELLEVTQAERIVRNVRPAPPRAGGTPEAGTVRPCSSACSILRSA
jgi:hypothetical protein